MMKPAYCKISASVVKQHGPTALSPLTGALLKSEIREFVA